MYMAGQEGRIRMYSIHEVFQGTISCFEIIILEFISKVYTAYGGQSNLRSDTHYQSQKCRNSKSLGVLAGSVCFYLLTASSGHFTCFLALS